MYTRLALAFLLLGCGGGDVEFSGDFGHQLVGFTQSTQTGDATVFGLTKSCQSEFPGSRVCSSIEVLETTRVPGGLEGDAWVRPTFVASIDRSMVDASGLVLLGGPASNCDQWKGTASTGLVVDASGIFHSGSRARCSEAHAVACCAPASR